MAYFANSTMGEHFDEQCENCVHGFDETDPDPKFCPVARLQLDWNYSQIKDGDQKLALDILVPQKDTGEANCWFFKQKQDYPDMFK